MEKFYLPLSAWKNEEKPRERLLKLGVAALSTHELLAIILRSGRPGETALELSLRILSGCGNDLNELAKLGVPELMKSYKGIGMAKATGIVVAMELGRRRMTRSVNTKSSVHSSSDVYAYISPLLRDLEHEEFWVIYLNRRNQIRGCEQLSLGGMSSTVIDVRILFRRALEMKANGIIVAHNHPGGSVYPSEYDKAITEKIREGGKILDIILYDHIIVGGDSYFSFIDEDMLENRSKNR